MIVKCQYKEHEIYKKKQIRKSGKKKFQCKKNASADDAPNHFTPYIGVKHTKLDFGHFS